MKPITTLCVACLLLIPAPSFAQSVTGRLIAKDSGRPLPGARLYLLGQGGAMVDSTVTARDGAFRLGASDSGAYNLYFQMDGWASIASNTVQLTRDAATTYDFHVQMVPTSALREMSERIRTNTQLQAPLHELCGEAVRLDDAGMLVGVVRMRSSRSPVRGARVTSQAAGGIAARSTITTDTGLYVLCNVPGGPAIGITIDATDGTVERTDVEIRPGTISWYDLPIGKRR